MEALCQRDRAVINSLFNPLLPVEEALNDELLPEEEDVAEEGGRGGSEEAQKFNLAGVTATEERRHPAALTAFTAAIAAAPSWAAPYNNRAQLHRIMRQEDEAIKDLDKAIELTNGKGKVGCQALIQRGLIHRYKEEDRQALDLFKQAAALGSRFAKTQLVEMNPMAALCNQMLARMVREVRGFPIDNNSTERG